MPTSIPYKARQFHEITVLVGIVLNSAYDLLFR